MAYISLAKMIQESESLMNQLLNQAENSAEQEGNAAMRMLGGKDSKSPEVPAPIQVSPPKEDENFTTNLFKKLFGKGE